MQRDIRDLLTHSRESFDTIQLELACESNGPVMALAMERSIPDFQERLASGSIVRFEASRVETGTGDDDPWARYEWRVWWRKPSCWRDDLVWETGTAGKTIVCDGASSMYVPQTRTQYTTRRPVGLLADLRSLLAPRRRFQLATVEERLEQIPLVDASYLAGGWELAVLDERMHAGRNAVRVRATRIGAASRLGVWNYIDQYEILVDAERGILLRYAGIVDGEEAGVMSVRSVRFDEPIPDEVFSDEPPKGTKIIWG
jgi:outer membrane lipoprotein-sorting protein